MSDFLRFLVTPLLTSPDQLDITTSGSTVTLKVADSDIGRVIGKHGSVINSLRVLTKTYCLAHRQSPVTLVLNSPPLKKD